MSKHPSTPSTRLICFGGARAQTNDTLPAEFYEDEIGGLKYDV